ncbi:phospholipase carboxylesterase domain containing [Cystoisospora suis]|uniref:Phospholipase carboxylesterase domain containing n=1 Tax=Cystoisospora suis TaxID=483139 RepID=A0A2C6J8X0_9APIC|nr:phospholipase carboxylesterase domain containing [Cystoisospora suis]
METPEMAAGVEPRSPSMLLMVAGLVARATWVGGALVLCVVGLMWYFQEKLLFYPGVPRGFETPERNPKGLRHPEERGLPYEEVWVKTVDGIMLHCWLIKQKFAQVSKSAPTILFFHGNAGNMGFRLPNIELLYKHVGVNVFIISYRGYGHSEGFPTEPGVYRDAEAALNVLMERHEELGIDPNKIFVFGRSLGGAVAIHLATNPTRHNVRLLSSFSFLSQMRIRGLIVENTFTSLFEMVLIVFPFLRPFRRLVRVVQRMHMDNAEKVKRLQTPILFISGMRDELVPCRHMRKLFDLCASPLREKEEVSLGGHNDTWEWAVGGKSYYDRIAAFIQHALDFKSPSLPSTTSGELASSSSVMDKDSSSRICPRISTSHPSLERKSESPRPCSTGDEAIDSAVDGSYSSGSYPLCKVQDSRSNGHPDSERGCVNSSVSVGTASPEEAFNAASSAAETAASSVAAEVTGMAGSTFPDEVGSQYSNTLRERVAASRAKEGKDEL